MKYIFEHMLEVIIIGIVVFGLLFIINNLTVTSKNGEKTRGFLNIIGSQLKEQQDSKAQETGSSEILKNILRQKTPEIFFSEDRQGKMKCNVYISILNYFKVKFFENSYIYDASALADKKLKIENITDIRGESVLDTYDSTNKTVYFSDPGIYTINFCIMDSENKVTFAAVSIPIDS